jgi:hypothetical protein
VTQPAVQAVPIREDDLNGARGQSAALMSPKPAAFTLRLSRSPNRVRVTSPLKIRRYHVANEHETNQLLTRREFTAEWALALLAGVTITITGCGDDDTPTSPSPTPEAANGVVSANHGHVATATAAQITAGGAVALDIRGEATHPHTVELTADDVRRISQRSQVVKTSTTDNGHQHTVTFN